MNKILSVIVVSLLVMVAVPTMALAACAHGHGSHGGHASPAVLGAWQAQNQIQFCNGGGYIYLSDPTSHCPTN